MFRVLTSKKIWALAAVAAVAAVGLSPVTPVMAATAPAHRAASVPSVTLDFTGTGSGVGFAGSSAPVKGENGTKVGTVYDQCDSGSVTASSVVVLCSGDIVYDAGDQITFQVVAPVKAPAEYPASFDGVVTGSTGVYEGLTGAVHFTNISKDVYVLTFG